MERSCFHSGPIENKVLMNPNAPRNNVPSDTPQYFGPLEDRTGLAGDTNNAIPFSVQTTYDDGGVSGPSSASSNQSITYFSLVSDPTESSSELQSACETAITPGTLLFGIRRNAGNTNRERFTLFQLNCLMYEDCRTRSRKKPGQAAFASVSEFMRRFFFVGVTLLSDKKTAGQLDRSTEAGGYFRRVVDQTIKGVCSVSNVWGNCATPVEKNAYLWLALKWIPYSDKYEHSHIKSKYDLIYNNATGDTTYTECHYYFLQLVPVCTHDDRPPHTQTHGIGGTGALIYIGRVLDTEFPVSYNKQHGMYVAYRNLVFPDLSIKDTDTIPSLGTSQQYRIAREQCEEIQVAVSCGNQHFLR